MIYPRLTRLISVKRSSMYSKILIAHDLSKEAEVALQRAVQLAEQHQAELSILHVVEDSPSRQAFIDIQKKLEPQLRASVPEAFASQVSVYFQHGKAADAVLSFLQVGGGLPI